MTTLRERLEEAICRYVPPREATAGTHGLFRYPAKYLPQIAGPLLDELVPPGGRVLDPFAGSGTTLVEASRRGIPSLGVDLNPLAVLVSSAKTTRIEPDRLVAGGDRVVLAARRFTDAPIPEFRNRDYWFPEESLTPLARLRAAIDRVEDRELREVLLVVFLGIVKLCSNASSYQHKLTRSRDPDPVTGEAVEVLFAKRVRRAARRFESGPGSGPNRCITADARRLPVRSGAFDAVITHPPYSISFDFVRSFKIYLWWLDPARDTVALDRLMVGNQRRLTGEPPRTGLAEIDEITDAVYEQDARDGLAVGWFFTDMERALAECRRVLRPGGALAVYIGDSQARWIQLRAPGNLAALAERQGFSPRLRLPRRVPEQVASGNRRIFVEELLVFRART